MTHPVFEAVRLREDSRRGRLSSGRADTDAVRFVFAQGDADGYLLNSHGQIRRFPTHHQAWKWIDNLKGNEPDPY